MPGRIGDTSFLDLLCNSLAADETTAAIAEALEGALLKSVKGIPEVLIYARLALARPEPLAPAIRRAADLAGGLTLIPEPLLDLLAWQYHVDGYEAARTYEAKRALVDRSILLHRRKGTPWSVRNALQSAFQADAGISEWFQYGGNPYFFRVSLDVSGIEWNEAKYRDALRLIYEYKNVRSWLDLFITRWRKLVEIWRGAALRSETAAKARLYFQATPPAPARHFMGASVSGFSAVKQRPYFMPPAKTPAELFSGAALAGLNCAKIRFCSQAPKIRSAREYCGACVSAMTKSAVSFDWQNPWAHSRQGACQIGLTSTRIKFYRRSSYA